MRSIVTAFMVALTLTATAATLTPEEALNAAMTQRTSNLRRIPMKARGMELTYQLNGASGPTVYVFEPKGEDSEGFMVVSADDVAEPLLGYSDTERFDPDNIPPQLTWWLSHYSYTIERLVENPAEAPMMNIANRQTVSAGMRVRRAPRAAIAPICKTTWNQSSPYNNACPTLSGMRAVTGCVATAMAQVMKAHQWPTKGSGSHSYSYKYNNKSYTESFSFYNTTFKWSSMLNDYSGNYTATQASAVATLMHACGVASDMTYSPDGSGTSDLAAAHGLVSWLGYDLGLHAEWRCWHLADDWNDLVYEELSAGRPLLYSGNDGESGHAFVCDGFDGSKYYHINWGWGGIADGYFLLADLNPANQGIGGGSGISGFNYDQSILVGVKKAESGSKRPLIVACDTFTTESDKYSLLTEEYILIESDGFYNLSTGDIEKLCVGVVLEDSSGNQGFCPGMMGEDLKMLYGFAYIPIWTEYLSSGTYKAYPAIATDEYGSDLALIKYNPTLCGGYLNIEVKNSVATVSVAKGQADTGSEDPGEPEATRVDISLKSTSSADGCVTGKTYNFNYAFTVDGSYNETFYMLLVNKDKMTVAAEGDTKSVVAAKAGTVNQSFNLTIPSDLDLDYTYVAALCTVDGNSLLIRDYYPLSISAGSSSSANVYFDIVDVVPGDDPLLTDTNYKFTISFTSDEAFTTSYVLALVDYDSMTPVEDSNEVLVNLANPGWINVTFPLYIPADLTIGPQYIIAICTITDDGYLRMVSGWYVNIAPRGSGVEAILADPATDQLYDLQGRQVTQPDRGRIYIERTPAGSRKVVK